MLHDDQQMLETTGYIRFFLTGLGLLHMNTEDLQDSVHVYLMTAVTYQK